MQRPYARFSQRLGDAVERIAPHAAAPDGAADVDLVHDRIEAAELPGEIALIPFLESGFDPFAYSEGRAAGLWQFMSPTAKRFGLRQSWWYDGRRDVTASTEAAIRYLEYLQDRYEDWTLSIGAYKSGEGRMWRAIRSTRRSWRALRG